jgi:O-antigen/teichoic acid export membrane protein
MLTQPIQPVVSGTYAELTDDRLRLSKAFFYVNTLLIRSSFLVGGILFWIAPEFIYLVLGEKWMPMLSTFRLMLVFTLLDPLKNTIANLITVAAGKPDLVARARFVQLLILLLGLFILGSLWNIEGVAVAVNVMMVTGIIILLYQARKFVDVSVAKLFFGPGISLIIAFFLTYSVTLGFEFADYSWVNMGKKFAIYFFGYVVVMFILERQSMMDLTYYFLKVISNNLRG